MGLFTSPLFFPFGFLLFRNEVEIFYDSALHYFRVYSGFTFFFLLDACELLIVVFFGVFFYFFSKAKGFSVYWRIFYTRVRRG